MKKLAKKDDFSSLFALALTAGAFFLNRNMAKKYNLHLIKVKRSYSPAEIAKLFFVDKQTCLKWILNEGLKPLQEGVKPLLVMGSALKVFLKAKEAKRKCTLGENEYYCVKCHKGVQAQSGSEQTQDTGRKIGKGKWSQIIKMGFCIHCGTRIQRFCTALSKGLSS